MQSALPSQDFKVKLLLAGGHEYTVYLKPDEQLLRNLLSVMVARSQKQETGFYGLFQIPLEGGRISLCFPSDQLVGIVSEPPLFVQPTEEAQQPTQSQPPLITQSVQAAQQVTQPQPSGILPSHYAQIDNFLTLEERHRLLNYVIQQESAFVSTSTSTGGNDYRQSKVLYSFPEFSKLMIEHVQTILPTVFSKLGLTPFPIAEIEIQLTAHNDGNYYKVHNDNGSPDTATREFTYIYYFYKEPKAFAGGELALYDSKVENNFYVKADSYKIVEPRNNSIVFFPSYYMHEVLTVSCPSKAFADSRFTINGWVRRSTNPVS